MPRRVDHEGPVQRAICGYLHRVLGVECVWFAIPNESDGSARMGARLNAQGRKAGVADMCIVHAGRALFLEVKADAPNKGYQTQDQKAFEAAVCVAGASYAVARSVDDVRGALARWGVPTREVSPC